MNESRFGSDLRVVLAEYDDFDESDFNDDGTVLGFDFGQKLVGHDEQTKECCGHIRKTMICDNLEAHAQHKIDGECHSGQVSYRKIRYWCHKPSCRVCMNTWAVQDAANIEGRIHEASLRFGQPEHIVISVPEKDLRLGMKALRHKAEKILLNAGVLGGSIIPHAFRFRPDHWYLGVHFHVIGFVLGGFGRCRRCEKRLERACPISCDGFSVRCYKEYLKSGWVIKVAHDRFGRVDARRSVWATAKYELSHATYDKSANSKRVHIITWFGVCSYRRLKWTPETKKTLCRLCGMEMKHGCYVGAGRFDLMPESGWSDFLGVDGRPQWVLIGEG